ncbi:MAG: GFA family protein [Deltaproteobacteria bacterium]|nr:GFA family protein [Deltaproteobacteria bacterium]
METYEGGCHCGAVRFRVVLENREAIDCNCSMCTKKGILHVIVPRARFTVLCGADQLTTYRFNTGVAQHTFCRTCGIHPFYVPRSHPNDIDVNIRCLDGDAWRQFNVSPFDGAAWEANVERIR